MNTQPQPIRIKKRDSKDVRLCKRCHAELAVGKAFADLWSDTQEICAFCAPKKKGR